MRWRARSADGPEGRMSLRITEECINCGACADACPTAAIFEDRDADLSVIDPERCTECVGFYERTMCQVECPVECCEPDPERVETQQELLDKARRLLPDHDFPDPPPSHFG
jgi:ferredoxin